MAKKKKSVEKVVEAPVAKAPEKKVAKKAAKGLPHNFMC